MEDSCYNSQRAFSKDVVLALFSCGGQQTPKCQWEQRRRQTTPRRRSFGVNPVSAALKGPRSIPSETCEGTEKAGCRLDLWALLSSIVLVSNETSRLVVQ